MAINQPPSNQVQPLQPLNITGKKKKQGSGFQNMDKTVQQNVQPAQAIGSQIQQGLQQQVQGAQGQLQGALGSAQAQTQSEQQRLGQAQEVMGQLGTSPGDVNKDLYKNLTSGRVQAADVGAIQNVQGKLGTAVQDTRNLAFDPMARQQAIAKAAGRSLTGQPKAGALGALDSSLLARTTNLQTAANEAARQGFGLDRQSEQQVKAFQASNKALQESAEKAKADILAARTSAIKGLETEAEDLAAGYNEDIQQLKDLVNAQDFVDRLPMLNKLPDSMQQKVTPEGLDFKELGASAFLRNQLAAAGIDLETADITDIGATEFQNILKQATTGLGPVTAQEAMSNEQRARLKALYGLEDELAGRDYLSQEQALKPIELNQNILKDLVRRTQSSKQVTEKAQADYEAAMQEILNAYSGKGDRQAYLSEYFKAAGLSPEERQKYVQGTQDEADLRAAFRKAAQTGSFDDIRINDLAEELGIGWGRAQNLIEQMRPYLQRGQTLGGQRIMQESDFVGQDIGGPAYGRSQGNNTFIGRLTEGLAAPLRETGRGLSNLSNDETLRRLGPLGNASRAVLSAGAEFAEAGARNPALLMAAPFVGPAIAGSALGVTGLNTAGQLIGYTPQMLSALDKMRKG